MKIAIDISPIVYGTGVSVYTKELVRALLKIDHKNHYVLFGGSLRRKDVLNDFLNSLNSSNFTGRVFSLPPTLSDLIWNRFHKLPIESLIGNVDVFHSSDWTQPVSSAYNVTTIHDLVPFLYPEWSDPKIISVHSRRLKWVKDEVDTIIVPSKQTKTDLMELGVSGKKITIIPEAVSPLFSRSPETAIKMSKLKYGVEGNYLVGIGINARKNTQSIIEAFKRFESENPGQYSLVLIGHPHISLNSTNKVVITEHVSADDYQSLVSGAEALIYPSHYEGFGIPILEAMKVGTPVITSHSGSMREVAGNAAVLVDPESVESIAKGIERALRIRKSLIVKGKKRESKYSWENAARLTLDVYTAAKTT